MIEDVKNIIRILDSATDIASWNEATHKLKELLQNYDEDKRSLQQLMILKDEYSSEVSRLESERSLAVLEKSRL